MAQTDCSNEIAICLFIQHPNLPSLFSRKYKMADSGFLMQ
jgi:hypothetical protein